MHKREVHKKVPDAQTTNMIQLEKDSAAVTLFRENVLPCKQEDAMIIKNLLIIFYNSKIPSKVQTKKQVSVCECFQNAKCNS